MKVSINARIINGPWGGGNQAAKMICEGMRAQGWDVLHDLSSDDIDCIFMIHPDPKLAVISYGINEIIDYLAFKPSTLLVHRVNTSGERKGDKTETAKNLYANKYADVTVFISEYLRKFYVERGFDQEKRTNCVILNGADPLVFNQAGASVWNGSDKLKIVTHHWSDNYSKGFDIYERLDQLLGESPFRDLFEFTIIGNVPFGLDFKNTKIMEPLHGEELAKALKSHHLYLTASRKEPAGMHHIEGMMCGLPVLYINSGAMPEYCSRYGIEFNLVNFEKRLIQIREEYKEYKSKVINCEYSGLKMAAEYVELLKGLDNAKPAGSLFLHMLHYAWYLGYVRPSRVVKNAMGTFAGLVRRGR